ncbi:MAG: hypothetical protein HQM08_27590 [Candidatus Riflebacteria bacterium]|nr:hypothetical protein [Candidatus Riflebacteria bacterium]
MKYPSIKYPVLLVFLLLSSYCSYSYAVDTLAFDGVPPTDKHFSLQQSIFQIINQRWKICDLFETYSSKPTADNESSYNKSLEIFDKQSMELGKNLIAVMDEPSREGICLVSEIYKSLDFVSRQALYPALQTLRAQVNSEVVNSKNGKAPLTDGEFRDYFPGYGYTEPGYKYRKGLEVSREDKGFFSQTDEQTITSNLSVDLTVTLDILNLLKGMLAKGTIQNLVVKEKSTADVNGVPTIVFKVSFSLVKSLVTKTTRRFEVTKVWFELSRAKEQGFGGYGPWEVCGKTYEIINDPTGDAVVTGVVESN